MSRSREATWSPFCQSMPCYNLEQICSCDIESSTVASPHTAGRGFPEQRCSVMTKSLQEALRRDYDKAPVDLPHPLPLAHVAPAHFFASIVSSGALEPRKCKVF